MHFKIRKVEERTSKIVELYFSGLSIEETVELLHFTGTKRDWTFAKHGFAELQ
jgi:hypothetical protein